MLRQSAGQAHGTRDRISKPAGSQATLGQISRRDANESNLPIGKTMSPSSRACCRHDSQHENERTKLHPIELTLALA